MSNICVCILCGLPGAGKTTLSGHLVENRNMMFISICYDKLIPWIDFSEPDVLSTWKSYRNEVLIFVKFLLENLTNSNIPVFKDIKDNLHLIDKDYALYLCDFFKSFENTQQKKLVFVIDDNMQYRQMRYEYYKVARELSCGYCVVYLNCSLQDCQKRNQQRPINEVVKLKSIKRINAQMEKPDNSKASWEKYYCLVNLEENSNETVVFEVCKIVQLALDNPVVPLPVHDKELIERTRMINRNNLRHQADLCLRKLIRIFMQQQNDPKRFSQTINYAKKFILNEISSGQIDEQDFFNASGDVDQEHLLNKMDSYLNSFLNI